MYHSWKKLKSLTGNKRFIISRVSIPEDQIEIDGSFQLPPLAELSMEDQIFIAAFIKTHGSIKQMENIFGISYPTVKNRLNKIADSLKIMDISVDIREPVSNIIDKLEQGEISVEEALKEMN